MGQKTLVGCAANRRLGASQTKVFARLFQKAAGEKMAKAHRGSWPFSRAAPSNPGPQPYKKARPARRLVQTQGLPSAEGVTDVARLARILQSPAFRKKRPVTAKLSRTYFFRCLPRCHRCRSDLPRATNAPRCARITSPSDTTCSPRRKTAFARPCTAIPSSGV